MAAAWRSSRGGMLVGRFPRKGSVSLARVVSLAGAAAVGAGLLGSAPAEAAFKWKFFGGDGSTYGGHYSAAPYGLVDQFTSVAGDVPSACTGPPACTLDEGDYVHKTLTFTGGGRPQLTASTDGANKFVIEDLVEDFGGMGVEGGGDTNDNITGGNVLRLTFGSEITITGIVTLFTDFHDNVFGNARVPTAFFKVRIDGVGDYQAIKFADANTPNGLSLTGTTFEFMKETGQPKFYVSAVLATPLPAAALLFGTALAGLAWLRRRRPKEPAVVAA
jgi:hypothetical protein